MDLTLWLDRELRPNERTNWSARPIPARIARGSWAIWFFAIPWTLFALFWTATASGIGPWLAGMTPAPPPFRLLFGAWGLPFIGVGLWMLSAPHRLKAEARNTLYAITNQAALIIKVRSNGTSTVTRLDFSDLHRREKVEHADGSGDLIFPDLAQTDSIAPRARGAQPPAQGFYGVPNVREAERSLEAALAAH